MKKQDDLQKIIIIAIVAIVVLLGFVILMTTKITHQGKVVREGLNQGVDEGGPRLESCAQVVAEVIDNCDDGMDCRDIDGNRIDCDCEQMICDFV